MAHIGLQLYTVRDRLQQDFTGTLKAVAEIGFSGVEFAGYGGMSAQDLRHLLDELGMRGVSSHIALTELQNVASVSDYARELGLQYVVCPWLNSADYKTSDDYARLSEQLGELGAAYAENGLTLCYHNHDFEFAIKTDAGQYVFDALYEQASPAHLKAELDTYWISFAGLDALSYVQKYAGRAPLLHLKDMTTDDRRTFAALGQGQLPIAELIKQGEQSGVQWFFVEQDVCPGDALDSVRTSFAFLRELGVVK